MLEFTSHSWLERKESICYEFVMPNSVQLCSSNQQAPREHVNINREDSGACVDREREIEIINVTNSKCFPFQSISFVESSLAFWRERDRCTR